MNAYLSEPISLIIFVTAVLLISMWVAPRQVTVGGFYQGASCISVLILGLLSGLIGIILQSRKI